MPAEGGTPKEVIAGDRNQGDPRGQPTVTPWSSGECLGSNRNAAGPNIHIVDLKTSQVLDLPSSENLFSPRCSQNGSFIAALLADSTKLMLYDIGKKSWSQLAAARFGFRPGHMMESISTPKITPIRLTTSCGCKSPTESGRRGCRFPACFYLASKVASHRTPVRSRTPMGRSRAERPSR